MGHLINPISFRVGFFGYWLDNWSPWQYYAYAEMLHQNLVLRDLLKEFLDGEFLRKASFFYSHFTIQYFEQKRFVIKIYYYDGLTEQVVQCVSTYWAKWAMKRNKVYKQKIRRFKFVKKTFVKDNLLFWWRYVDYNFASKIVWFLFLMMTLSFERKNRRSRGRRHYNYRFHKKRLKFLKRKRFLFTIDQYLKLVKRLRFNKRRFNFFKKFFFFYYRANFKRLWYTFLLRDPHFEVFAFLRVFFMLFFKYIRFAYYKRRFFFRTQLYTRISKKLQTEGDSIVNLFNYNRFAKKIISPAHMGVHPNFFMQHPYIPKRFKLKNRKLSVILKNFRWMWHYYFMHKHRGLKHYKVRLKYIYGDRVPYYIYNLPKRFFFRKRFLNKQIRFFKMQKKIKKIGYSQFYKIFLKQKQKRRRRFFLEEKKLSNIGRYYSKYLQHLRFIVLGGSKRIAANYYDNRWLFRNIKYKSPKNGYFVQLRHKQKAYRFLTTDSVLMKKVRKIPKGRYYVFKPRFFSRKSGYLRNLISARIRTKARWKNRRLALFRNRFKERLLNIKQLKAPTAKHLLLNTSLLNLKSRVVKSIGSNAGGRYYFQKDSFLKQRDFRYKNMLSYIQKNKFDFNKGKKQVFVYKQFLNFFYLKYIRRSFIKLDLLFKSRSFVKAFLVYKKLLTLKNTFFTFLKLNLVIKPIKQANLDFKIWKTTFLRQKKWLFKKRKQENLQGKTLLENYLMLPFQSYFAGFRYKFKYRCFAMLYKFIFMRTFVLNYGLGAYVQFLKMRANPLRQNFTEFGHVNKIDSKNGTSTGFSSYIMYRTFLNKIKEYKTVFAAQDNARALLFWHDLAFIRRLGRKYAMQTILTRMKKGYKNVFRKPFDAWPHKDELNLRAQLETNAFSSDFIFNKFLPQIGSEVLYTKRKKASDFATFLRQVHAKMQFRLAQGSLLNWKYLLMLLFKRNTDFVTAIVSYLKLTKKGAFFSLNSFYWVLLVLWFWSLVLKKRGGSLKIKKITNFTKNFFMYTTFRKTRFLKKSTKALWFNKYNKNFFQRKYKSYSSMQDSILLRKLRFGPSKAKAIVLAQYAFQQTRVSRTRLVNNTLVNDIGNRTNVYYNLKSTRGVVGNKNSLHGFNWGYINQRFKFLMKLLFWKEHVQYVHLYAIAGLVFKNINTNFTYFNLDSFLGAPSQKKTLQLNFFYKLKARVQILRKFLLVKRKLQLNGLGSILKYKNLVRKVKHILTVGGLNGSFVKRSSHYAKKYLWYFPGRVNYQKILRRRLYRHLVKISNYAHSDQYVMRLTIPSIKWRKFSLYKKFYTKMRRYGVKKPTFYQKRLVFLRSYWLYGLFSYYFVQRRAQFLYILNREKKAVDLIEPLYVYFSHYRVTDIICRRLVMGFVRSLLVMERFRIQFMYFEQKFIELCRNYVLYPFIVRFYGIDNDIVTAVFIARYISAKLEYKFSVWELFKPIGKDLKVVSRGTKMLLGYKLQFIGRLKRRDRLRYVYNMGGSLPLSKRDAFIEHGYFTGILKNGKCSVRVWIYRHKSFADFFFNYLYVLY